MTFNAYIDPLADALGHAAPPHAAPRPAPAAVEQPPQRHSYRPTHDTPRPRPTPRRDMSGEVPIPATLGVSILHRRDAVAAGMTDSDIGAVMADLRIGLAAEVMTPLRWGAAARSALDDAIRAHRAGRSPTLPTATAPVQAEPAVEQPLIEPEAAILAPTDPDPEPVAVERPAEAPEVKPEPAPIVPVMNAIEPGVAHPVAETGRASVSEEPQTRRSKRKHYVRPEVRIEFVFAATDDLALKLADLRTLRHIVGSYNHDDGYAIPGAEFMAGKAGVTRQSVSTAVAKLESRGWIKVERAKGKDGKNLANRYFPIWSKVPDHVGSTRHGDGNPCRVQHGHHVGSSTAAMSATPDTNPSATPDTNPIEGNPSGFEPDTKTRRLCAAAEHAGVLFLDEQTSAAAGARPDEPTAEPSKPDIKVELPAAFSLADDVVAQHLARGLSREALAASLARWRERNAGTKRTEAEWQRTGAAWLARERVEEVPGIRLPEDWWPTERAINHVIEMTCFGRSEVERLTLAFCHERRGAAGGRGVSVDWHSTWAAEVIRSTRKPKRGPV